MRIQRSGRVGSGLSQSQCASVQPTTAMHAVTLVGDKNPKLLRIVSTAELTVKLRTGPWLAEVPSRDLQHGDRFTGSAHVGNIGFFLFVVPAAYHMMYHVPYNVTFVTHPDFRIYRSRAKLRRLRLITWPCDLDLWPWNWYASRIKGGEPSVQIWVRVCFPASSGYSMLIYENEGTPRRRHHWRSALLFAMYATDRQTDRGTDKSNAYCPFPTGGGVIIGNRVLHRTPGTGRRRWESWLLSIVIEQTAPNETSLLPYVGRLGSGPHLVDRIGSGVRVGASFQKKIPDKFCPTATKVGLRPRGFCPGGGRGGLPPKVKYTSRVMVAVSILSVKWWRDLEMWVVTERVNVIIMFVGINSN